MADVLTTVPLGGLFFGWCTLMAVAPIRRPRRLAMFSWICSAVPSELPFLFLYIVVASSLPTLASLADGDLAWPSDRISAAVALLTVAGLLVVAGRSLRAGAVAERALGQALGPHWRSEIDPALAGRLRRHLPWFRILVVPWPFRPRRVQRVADIPYGGDGTDNLLDVYRHRSHPTGAPTLIHLHGGRFRRGRKSFEARPLLHHLAGQGWTCISANYHLATNPADGFPANLIDVKKVIAWARTQGGRHGVDPDAIFLAGSSAGAHLMAMTVLTAGDPAFQPGFEAADTSVAGGIGLYGYYGRLSDDEHDDHLPSTPLAYAGEAAPLCVIHGDHDTFTPIEGARRLVDALRACSSRPALVELPGAQHSFDLFHSVRFETAVDAIEAFTAWVRSQRARRSRAAGAARTEAT